MDFLKAVYILSEQSLFEYYEDFTKAPYFDAYFEYFLYQILNHPDFKYNRRYKVLIKLKVHEDYYYTLLKGLRVVFLSSKYDVDELKKLYIETFFRIHFLLSEHYVVDILSRHKRTLPEAILIEFFGLDDYKKNETSKTKISNILTIENNESINKTYLLNKDFKLFGGHFYNNIFKQDFFNDVFKGQTRKLLN